MRSSLRAIALSAALPAALIVLSDPAAALAQAIRLDDVTAGGDRVGTAPAVNTGVDERNGRFTADYVDGPVNMGDPLNDGLNPSPAPPRPRAPARSARARARSASSGYSKPSSLHPPLMM